MMREWVTRRSAFLADIRAFFAARGVLEVDTPLWRECGVTDAQLVSVAVAEGGFLQTSPEFAMKRLLSCGAGDIYQLAHVFRGEEAGRRHLREFMMLEWYRLGFDHWQLMEEVADLVRVLLPQAGAVRHTPYRRTFVEHLGVDVAALDAAGLRAFCVERLPECAAWQLGRDGWLGDSPLGWNSTRVATPRSPVSKGRKILCTPIADWARAIARWARSRRA